MSVVSKRLRTRYALIVLLFGRRRRQKGTRLRKRRLLTTCRPISVNSVERGKLAFHTNLPGSRSRRQTTWYPCAQWAGAIDEVRMKLHTAISRFSSTIQLSSRRQVRVQSPS